MTDIIDKTELAEQLTIRMKYEMKKYIEEPDLSKYTLDFDGRFQVEGSHKKYNLSRGDEITIDRFIYEGGKRSLSVIFSRSEYDGKSYSFISSVPNLSSKCSRVQTLLDLIEYKQACRRFVSVKKQEDRIKNAEMINMTKNMNLEHYRSW